MKKLWMIAVIALSILFMANSMVLGDSLWSDHSNSIYSSKKRNFEVGDLVTILIVENASASQQAETNTSKTGNATVGPGIGTMQQLFPSLGANWDSEFDGKGSNTRGGQLKATLCVQIKEVLPGGILTLEGRQVIRVNKEDQVIVISGNVRSDDIQVDNTVPSTRIANAVIEFQGRGTVSETQEPGILTKIFHWIF